jgi:hypothetical protein
MLPLRCTLSSRGRSRHIDSSLPRWHSAVAIDRTRRRTLRIARLRARAAAGVSRDDQSRLWRQSNWRVPYTVGVNDAVVAPKTSDSFGHCLWREKLRLVVVPDGHLCFGKVPEGCLVKYDSVVESTKVRICGYLLVARVALAVGDGGVCCVGVHAEVVQIREVESMVRE